MSPLGVVPGDATKESGSLYSRPTEPPSALNKDTTHTPAHIDTFLAGYCCQFFCCFNLFIYFCHPTQAHRNTENGTFQRASSVSSSLCRSSNLKCDRHVLASKAASDTKRALPDGPFFSVVAATGSFTQGHAQCTNTRAHARTHRQTHVHTSRCPVGHSCSEMHVVPCWIGREVAAHTYTQHADNTWTLSL